jgi:outer membrane protein OmpA-like peptidoglycan-associated protein
MKSTWLAVIIALMVATIPTNTFAQAHKSDVKGKDYPLFSRMQGFHRSSYQEMAFDRYQFPVGPKQKQAAEGHLYRITYWLNQGDGPLPSKLQIVRNHQNAVREVGGTVVYEDLESFNATTVMRVSRDGRNVWVQLEAIGQGHRYNLVIVEEEAMKQEIVADAETWRKDLNREGHVAVYGIYFDTDQAVIKPESEPALQEMAKLLAGDLKLSVFIVGHTDNTGTLEHNLKLSDARADAVVTALGTRHKIAAGRMRAAGVGPLAPVASNDTEEGRAKNRRVELVKR